MKFRKVSALVLGVSLTAVLLPATVMALPEDAYLVRDMSGDDVYSLQNALSQAGYLEVTADGVFGSYTEDAVRRYQQDHGLYVDGEAGPQVLAMLNESYVPTTANEGAAVAYDEGAVDSGAVDAGAAESTVPEATVSEAAAPEAAVSEAAVPEVAVSEAPVPEVAASDSSSYDLSQYLFEYGDNGDMVTVLQQALIELGYLSVEADGIFGSYTDAAVRSFQNDLGLYADGLAGPKTLGALPAKYVATLAQNTPAQNTPAQNTPVQQPVVQPSESQNAQSETASAGTYDFSNEYLQVGSSGNLVTAMQQALLELGYLTVPADGIFGSYTEAAVRAFQEANGLYPDGEAGPATLSILPIKYSGESSAAPQPVTDYSVPASHLSYDGVLLSLGSQGEEVMSLQNALVAHGYLNAVPDGIFGTATEDAVKRFQADNALASDGIAGQVTFLVLAELDDEGTEEGTFYRSGASGDAVYQLQKKLYDLGYLSQVPDGYYNDRTDAAVKLFQGIHGEKADGVTNPSLYNMIMEETLPFVPVGTDANYSSVTPVQQVLYSYRMMPMVHGHYEEDTSYAISQIQKMFNLPVTGVADAETMYHIYNYNNLVSNPTDVQGIYSDTNYMIYVNTTMNRVYVYEGGIWNWKELYNWECAAGRAETPTTTGEFTANFKGFSFGEENEYTCYYFTSFNGPYYIHSTLFEYNSWVDKDSRLGVNLSHGCVRMDVNNSKWIYDNIPLGTKVVVQ